MLTSVYTAHSLFIVLALSVAGSAAAVGGRTTSLRRGRHRKLNYAVSAESRLDGEYIVVFSDEYRNAGNYSHDTIEADVVPVLELVTRDKATITGLYEEAIWGFSVVNLTSTALWSLLDFPVVEFIDENQRVETTEIQEFAPWGLDRIDQAGAEPDGMYHYEATGESADVFIVDTGIRLDHVELGGRAECAFDVIKESDVKCTDLNRHGTHVAGVVGGITYGVAKNAHLKAVKVLNEEGSGSWDGVLAGLDFIAKNHDKNKHTIVNLSLAGGRTKSMDKAVAKLHRKGLLIVAAAGNSEADGCLVSPGGAKKALTVGALQKGKDEVSSYSNWGSCINVFAPGDHIPSSVSYSNSAVMELSGTSMAAPHVAGGAALYWERNPKFSARQIFAALEKTGVQGLIDKGNLQGSVNTIFSTMSVGNDLAICSKKDEYCESNSDCCDGGCRNNKNKCK